VPRGVKQPYRATPLFEVCVHGRPVSAQSANRVALRNWKQVVAESVRRAWVWNGPLSDDVSLDIVYYAEGVSGDLDNLLKPIQDALQGIAYNNDKQVRELKGARRDIDERYKVRFMPVVLGAAFADGRPFIHIRIWRRLETRELS
jgi:crossover junction endodeoxyribonuclease RusA